jgi:hypothetical protein
MLFMVLENLPEQLRRIIGACFYALASFWSINFFFVQRILHSEWGSLITEPTLFQVWYPCLAFLSGFIGWYLRRGYGLFGFSLFLIFITIESLLPEKLPDYHFDYVLLWLVVPMALAEPIMWLCRCIFHLESYPVIDANEA